MWTWTDIRAKFPVGGFGRGVATLVTGTGIGQVIVIAGSPVLTRLYSPSDFGVYAVAVSILAVLLTIASLSYELAVPLPESDVDAANVLALSLLTTGVTSLLAAGALLVAGRELVTLLGAPGLAPYVLLIPLSLVGGGLSSTLARWAIRAQTYSAIAATRVTQSVSLVAVQVGLGGLGAGAPGLLVGDVVGRVAGSMRLARAAWKGHAGAFRAVSREGIADAAVRYRRFPMLSTWSALLATIGLQAPLLFIVAFYGPETGGEFALAARVSEMPLALIAGAVGQVFVAEAARLIRTDPKGVAPLFGRTTRALAVTALGPALLAMIAAPFLAVPVFGDSWQQVGIFIAVLVPSFFLEFVIAATGDVLYVLERQELHLVREILRFLLVGGAIPLAAALGLPAVGAIALLSAGRCLTYLAYGLVSWRAVARHAKAQSVAGEIADDN